MAVPVRGFRQSDPLRHVERAEALERLGAGERVEEVAASLGCSGRTLQRLWADSQVKSRRIGQSELRLSFAEREQISRGLAAGLSARAISRTVARSPSTITREINGNGGRKAYRALGAHRRAIRCSARPKVGKLARMPRLKAAVEAGLQKRWSPQQISARLQREHPADEDMQISHETIYQSLYVQSRGELRRELTACLRRGRSTRKPRGTTAGKRGKIPGMVSISQRPATVEDRAVPGHWEGDLIIGARGRSAIATLVERQTRFVMLAYLGTDRTSQRVISALQERIALLPTHLVQTLTWDQGTELSAHAQFTVRTGVDVFFCDPHSPWQRGSNENTNGLLRQYLPKGTDLAVHTQTDLDRIASELNRRPRQTLDWMTPAEKINELLLR
jgi:IS30 family transposase